jgi:DNA-binding transcriptional regulator YiaG
MAAARKKQRQWGETTKGSSERIRAIREELTLSQEAFAECLGVARNSVSRWETGDLIPPKLAVLAAEYLLLTFNKPKRMGEAR